ncbi:hypothetical protein LOC71_19660 [Rhodopirellula sp. JC740]|uniref:DUF983 domain-containing protein n=1 Tax=Rhodopirellula halodulae TaxID=2894198 RepID=A0ABS8NLS0_9BACT|nr:hypothetical protein [Rhodopirellula sp. JC740]MCC9644495.1 hypothetical protein [Rhodopirellula sp. JC740]
MTNPYQPPPIDPEPIRHRCPVCRGAINRWRFLFPFQHCEHCGNYLTIRHWGQNSWWWVLSLIAVTSFPIFLRANHYIQSDPPVLSILIGWNILWALHGKLFGQIVPAFCWGLLAERNDERSQPETPPLR